MPVNGGTDQTQYLRAATREGAGRRRMWSPESQMVLALAKRPRPCPQCATGGRLCV